MSRPGSSSAYFAFGLAGVVAAAALVVVLTVLGGAPQATGVIAVVAPQVGFLLSVRVASMITGRERIVLYEVVPPSLLLTAAVLAIGGQPVAIGLELATLGFGAALVGGRLGCLTVGCCHGRPARIGIRYGERHARAGFPAYLVGIRLFPIQAIESVVHLVLTAIGARLFVRPHHPGEVMAMYAVLYAPIRFALELARGDAARPYLAGLSESQWIAAGNALAAAIWCAITGSPYRWLAAAVAGALVLASAVLVLLRRRLDRGAWGARHPHRLRELGLALAALGSAPAGEAPAAVDTESGLRLSRSIDGGVEHLALSRAGTPLSAAAAAVLADRIRLLRRHAGSMEVVAGKTGGVFHVFLRPEMQAMAAENRSSAAR